jgi:hypothetical protein
MREWIQIHEASIAFHNPANSITAEKFSRKKRRAERKSESHPPTHLGFYEMLLLSRWKTNL